MAPAPLCRRSPGPLRHRLDARSSVVPAGRGRDGGRGHRLCCLATNRCPGRGWKPLVATGQMALTWYMGHILIGLGGLVAFDQVGAHFGAPAAAGWGSRSSRSRSSPSTPWHRVALARPPRSRSPTAGGSGRKSAIPILIGQSGNGELERHCRDSSPSMPRIAEGEGVTVPNSYAGARILNGLLNGS